MAAAVGMRRGLRWEDWPQDPLRYHRPPTPALRTLTNVDPCPTNPLSSSEITSTLRFTPGHYRSEHTLPLLPQFTSLLLRSASHSATTGSEHTLQARRRGQECQPSYGAPSPPLPNFHRHITPTAHPSSTHPPLVPIHPSCLSQPPQTLPVHQNIPPTSCQPPWHPHLDPHTSVSPPINHTDTFHFCSPTRTSAASLHRG